jgi:hypothetical protein
VAIPFYLSHDLGYRFTGQHSTGHVHTEPFERFHQSVELPHMLRLGGWHIGC